MWRAWTWLVLLCAVCGAILFCATWYSGEGATAPVWFAAIWFNIDVALRCAKELLEAA